MTEATTYTSNPAYLLQSDGWGCTLYALCNALAFYGRDRPEPDSDAWRELEVIGGCIHGPATRMGAMADKLQLELVELDAVHHLHEGLRWWSSSPPQPAALTVDNPQSFGGALHMALVVGSNLDDTVTLVNYSWRTGPVIERVPWAKLSMPPEGNANRRAWQIKLRRDDAGVLTSPWTPGAAPAAGD